MMLIKCPYCGNRPENEFSCGGTAHLVRPPTDCSDEDWYRYMFERDNPIGNNAERWRHTYGCSQWFNMIRDTLTHEIKEIYGITEQPSQQISESKQ